MICNSFINKTKIFFVLFISKTAIAFLRLLKLGGTTLPGRIAVFFMRDILKHFGANLNQVIIVTGTNGKTTTCRIIGKIFEESKIPYFTNKSGANLLSGIVSTLIENANFDGTFNTKNALFEIDEAALPKITKHLKANYIVVTNFFRDQLDRYGELYTTVKSVQTGVEQTDNSVLIINADESLSSSIAKNTSKKTIFFGFSTESSQKNNHSINTDAGFCIYCKTKYLYDFRTFGHLGGFNCPGCGFSRTNPQISCERVLNLTSSYSDISINFSDEESASYQARINLPGIYNIYNALAAASLGHAMGIPHDKIINALETFECGFGRMEVIETNGKFIKIILVKNPTGFNQVINLLLTEDKNTVISFLLNDNHADSTDISWIWDVAFEKFEAFQNNVSKFLASGKRAEDVAVRLKYAGIFKNNIEVSKDYESLINIGLSKIQKGESFYILPTYTAMLEIRKILRKKFKLKEFWK